MDQRTTAIIQPRIAASIYGETTTSTATEKSWEENQNYKSHQNATKTIAAVSLMIMLSGFLNSGLCLYMTSVSSTLNLYVSNFLLEYPGERFLIISNLIKTDRPLVLPGLWTYLRIRCDCLRIFRLQIQKKRLVS